MQFAKILCKKTNYNQFDQSVTDTSNFNIQ